MLGLCVDPARRTHCSKSPLTCRARGIPTRQSCVSRGPLVLKTRAEVYEWTLCCLWHVSRRRRRARTGARTGAWIISRGAENQEEAKRVKSAFLIEATRRLSVERVRFADLPV